MSALLYAEVVARLSRCAGGGDLVGVCVTAPDEGAAAGLRGAIERAFPGPIDVEVRIKPGPPRILSIEFTRSPPVEPTSRS